MPNRNRSEEAAKLRAQVRELRASLKRLGPGLEVLLRRRSFLMYKKEAAEDLLVPAKRYRIPYYRLLHRYSFRLFLRDVIKQQEQFSPEDVTRYATPAVTRRYLELLLAFKLVRRKGRGSFKTSRHPIRSFGPTLEWYIAEVLKREFGCEAAWGVKFRRPKVGGDYDVLARVDGELLYAEVKSSPPKQIYDSQVAAFLDRVQDLAPEISIFLMDTELRMKDKIVPLFEQELAKRFPRPPAVERMERELFQVNDRIFIVNAKEEVLQNIRTVLSWYYQRARAPLKGAGRE